MSQKVGPFIGDTTEIFILGHFANLNAGATYCLDAFPALYARSLHEMRGTFSQGELSLIVDVFNSTALTAGLAGQQIIPNVVDGCELDRLAEKWEIEKVPLVAKLEGMPVFSLACLEIWANGFWYAKAREEADLGKEEFAKWLAKLL